jgi:hypothetical protein
MRCSGTRVGVGVIDGRGVEVGAGVRVGVDARVGAGVMVGKGVEVASGVRIGADACVGLDVTEFGGRDVGERVEVSMGEDNLQPVMLIASRIDREICQCHGRLLVLFIKKSSFLVTVSLVEASFILLYYQRKKDLDSWLLGYPFRLENVQVFISIS